MRFAHSMAFRSGALPTTLAPGCAVWWSVDVSRISAVDIDRLHNLLSFGERERIGRLRRPDVQDEAIVSRASLRLLLAWFTGVSARRLVLRGDAFGRPVLELARGADDIAFNVSHSRGQIHIGMARKALVGIDVEYVDDRFDYGMVAKTVLSKDERARLYGLPASQRGRVFYSHWVAKEAYVKALGLGLYKDVSRIELDRADNMEWRLRDLDADSDVLGCWRIWPDFSSSEFVAALVAHNLSATVSLETVRVISTPLEFRHLLEVGVSSAPKYRGNRNGLE